jgi:hypothetical protein
MERGTGQFDSLSEAAAPRPNRRATGRAVGITLVFVVAATICGWIFVPEQTQGVVTVLGVVTAVTLVGAVALPRWPERLWPILTLAFLAIGTVLVSVSAAVRPYGVIAILLAIAVFPVFAATAGPHVSAWAKDQPTPPRPGRRTMVLSLVSGAMIAATVLGFIAMHGDGKYAVTNGQPVTVSIGTRCRVSAEALEVTSATCPDSRWTIDGQTYRGTVHIGAGELDVAVDWRGDADLVFRNRTIEAYAIPGDDDAYTPGSAADAIDGLEVFRAVPWWLVFAAPLLVVALIVGAIVRRFRRRLSSSSSASASAS